MDLKYCIVEFFPETSGGTSPTEVVPNIWIDRASKFVYWPPKAPAALKVAIRKATESPSQNWGIHRYNRILGEYGKFAVASLKLKKSLDTSNLESEQEVHDLPLQKRRRIHQSQPLGQASSSEDSDSSDDQREGTHCPLPSFGFSDDKDLAEKIRQDISAPVPATVSGPTLVLASPSYQQQGAVNVASDSTLSSNGTASINHIQSKAPIGPQTPTSSRTIFVNTSSPPQSPSVVDQPLTVNELEDPTLSIATVADVTALKEYMTECTAKLIRMITALSEEVKEIKAYLHTTRPSGSTPKLDFTKIPSLPLLEREQLTEFENWLLFEANREILREYLGLLGGETTGKCSRGILKKLISKPLRKEIFFTGKGGKVAFQSLRVYEILKESVRITRTDAKEADIQHAVIEWLRNAKKNE